MDYNSDNLSKKINTCQQSMILTILLYFTQAVIKITSKYGEASLQLPVKYSQLSAILTGQCGTLMWGMLSLSFPCVSTRPKTCLEASSINV